MTVEFFGVRGFGPINGTGKIDRPGTVQKGDRSGKSDFASALQNSQGIQGGTEAQMADRARHIQSLKAQVESGEYQPDLQKVATSLLKFLVEG